LNVKNKEQNKNKKTRCLNQEAHKEQEGTSRNSKSTTRAKSFHRKGR